MKKMIFTVVMLLSVAGLQAALAGQTAFQGELSRVTTPMHIGVTMPPIRGTGQVSVVRNALPYHVPAGATTYGGIQQPQGPVGRVNANFSMK